MQRRLSPVLENALRNAGLPRLVLAFPFILVYLVLQRIAFLVAPGYMGRRESARFEHYDRLAAWQGQQLAALRMRTFAELSAMPERTELAAPPQFEGERFAVIREMGRNGGIVIGVALFKRVLLIASRMMPSFEMLPDGSIVGDARRPGPEATPELEERPEPINSIPEDERPMYQPLFVPWMADRAFLRHFSIADGHTLVSVDRCRVLHTLLQQAAALPGDVWECGVYQGGTAAMMAALMSETMPSKRLYLFDTFQGMPTTDPAQDWHKAGDMSETSLEKVRSYVGRPDTCVFRPGFIPDTFAGLEANQIAFAHIDVDIYRSVLDSVAFIWPRLSAGGFVVFDDYGFPTCRGARIAVDEFFAATNHRPLCIPTGQAIVFKMS